MYYDRGMLKWAPAAFLSERYVMQKESERDALRKPKPVLDEYQITEIDDAIHLAMEFAYFITFSIWRDGFIMTMTGRIGRLDEVGREVYIAGEDGFIVRIKFAEIVGAIVIEI